MFDDGFYGPDDHFIGSWQQKPEEKPFPVQDIGAPTWIEEQRVLRAFWRVQLFHDLKTVVNTCLLRWRGVDVMALDRMIVVDLYYVPWYNLLNPYAEGLEDTVLEQELIRSVVEYSKEDRPTIIAPTFL